MVCGSSSSPSPLPLLENTRSGLPCGSTMASKSLRVLTTANRSAPSQAMPPSFFASNARSLPARSTAVALSPETRHIWPRSRSTQNTVPSGAMVRPLRSEKVVFSGACQVRRNWISDCCAAALKATSKSSQAVSALE